MKLLTEFTQNPSLLKHALSVEAAMKAYARHFEEDVAAWGIVGLIHDFDYEQNQTEETHLHVGCAVLRERGWPEEWVLAVASHADYMGVPRDCLMRKSLFAVDELTGFLTKARIPYGLIDPAFLIQTHHDTGMTDVLIAESDGHLFAIHGGHRSIIESEFTRRTTVVHFCNHFRIGFCIMESGKTWFYSRCRMEDRYY